MIDLHEYAREERRVILLGVPTFGQVSIQWHAQQMVLKKPMNRIVRHSYVIGREVGDARNEIVQQALAFVGPEGERCEFVFFVDDDVLVPPEALIRLVSANRPILSGLYYAKTETDQPLVLDQAFGGARSTWMPGEILECYGHGMGCTIIRWDVFEKIRAAGLAVETGAACTPCHGSGRIGEATCGGCGGCGHLLRWFATTRDDLRTRDGVPVVFSQTEDLFFLDQARTVGFSPAVDTGLFCFHWDATKRTAYPRALWEEFRSHGTLTWQTPQGPVVWKGMMAA